MFFNAGRMGFRHFKMPILPGDPGVSGDPGSFGTGCFGLTNDAKIVFGFNTFSVPDQPAFSYLYNCADAAKCLSSLNDNGFNAYERGCESSLDFGGESSEVDPAQYCSCTGSRYINLNCWKDSVFVAAGGNPILCNPPKPSGIGLCELAVDEQIASNVCDGWPIQTEGGLGNPSGDELCEFCTDGVTGSETCGISVPYVAPCMCTSITGQCQEGCPDSGCGECAIGAGLQYLHKPGSGNLCTAAGADNFQLSTFISEWGNPGNSGATGWGASCNPITIDAEIFTYFNNGVCGTPEELAISVTELGPGITSTNQIKPYQFMSVSGHACNCDEGSIYQTFFSYLTFDENDGPSGTTFCNLYLGGLVAGPCGSPINTRPDCGCTHNFLGTTYEVGFAEDDDYPTNLTPSTVVHAADTSYLRNIGCSHALARYYAITDLSAALKQETRTFRRIDNSEIDTCGVNPCFTSRFHLPDSDEPSAGFDGTGCRQYIGADPLFPKKVINGQGDSNNSLYYERYMLNCDLDSDFPQFVGGGTNDLVAGIDSDRNAKSEEAVNRVGRRSEQYFDLPLSSVGTARSFFAPWVDDMIHQIATPNISARRMFQDLSGRGGDQGFGAEGGDLLNEGVNHLAQGPYPAYSYYSWFYGPMFDASEVWNDHNGRDFGGFGTQTMPANHAAAYKRFEGQWGPHVFGKFLTHPGFLGKPEDTMSNLQSASRGYFDSWGAIKLNNFWKYSGSSVFTGGTLAKFTDTLSTGVEAFGNLNQNKKNESDRFVWGGAEKFQQDPDHWPPDYTGGELDGYEPTANPMGQPLAGATALASPLDHNPHGITAHSSLGWCSAVNRQNCSWLNPRFTVMSNWLWPGGRKDYTDDELKLLFYLSTVNIGDLDIESPAYSTSNNNTDAVSNFRAIDEINTIPEPYPASMIGVTGTSIEIPLAHQDAMSYDNNQDNFGGNPSSLYFNGGNFDASPSRRFGRSIDDETAASPFAPLNRVFNTSSLIFSRQNGGQSNNGRVHQGWQTPSRYQAFTRQPFWEPNPSGIVKGPSTNGNFIQFTPHVHMNMSVGFSSTNAQWSSGQSFRRFGMFTDAIQPDNPNQRFEGMDRYNLERVLPTNPAATGDMQLDPERTIIPSPSILPYYALPIIGGWGYAGPDSVVTSYDDMAKFRGVGCGQGYLWGSFGRDIIWTSAKPDYVQTSRTYKNYSGGSVTGATYSDRYGEEGTAHSSLHSQRMFASGSNANARLATDALEATHNAEFDGATGASSLTIQTGCKYDGWKQIRASHCLLDISSTGIKTIKSSFVGCTAFYHATNSSPNAGNAQAVYQFNGNGWWYRTHEQLRLGINEEGSTCGVGPVGWIRHQNGYFPGYVADQTTNGDRMYGPNNTCAIPSNSEIDGSYNLRGGTVDSGHGFLQDVIQANGGDGGAITNATVSAFTSLSKNSQVNNGWTACAIKDATISGYQKQATESHFPEIETGFYPTLNIATGAGNIDILDDTKMFDAVFAYESGSTAGVTADGYFTLVNQGGDTLTIRVTGGAASAASSINSMPINLNIEPFEDSLNTFGETADLMCMSTQEISNAHLGDCSRINDHTEGGYKVWPSGELITQIRGWRLPNVLLDEQKALRKNRL